MASRSEIARVVLARFTSRMGSEAAFFVGVWGKAAYTLDATPSEMAAIMFVASIAAILGSMVGGAAVDRFGPRLVLIGAEVLFVPAALAVAFADTIPLMTVLVGIWAFVGSPVVTSGASFAPFMASETYPLERINARVEGAASLSFAVGPALGAVMARWMDVGWLFVLDAATSLVAAALVASIRLPRPERAVRGDAERPFRGISEGFRTGYRSRNLRYYLLTGTVVWLAFGAFGALEPLFFRDVVGADVEMLGWMNSIFGVGFVLGATLLPRLPRSIISARGLTVLVGLTGLGALLYVGSADLRIIATGAFVWSLVVGVMEPLLRTLLHRDSPTEVTGRVIGAAEVHHRAGELIPLAIAPSLATAFGVQPVLIGGGLITTIAAAFAYAESAAIDRERPAREPLKLEGLNSADEPISPTR